MITNFPSNWSAPAKLLDLDGHCGPICIWGVLKYFRIRCSSSDIIKTCHHTKKHGCFTICLAATLRTYGLDVEFYTDVDPSINPIEKVCYKVAEQIGIKIEQALDLDAITSRINNQSIAILPFETLQGQGHFSPYLGMEGENLILPYSSEEKIPKSSFIPRWDKPDTCRQCVIVSK